MMLKIGLAGSLPLCAALLALPALAAAKQRLQSLLIQTFQKAAHYNRWEGYLSLAILVALCFPSYVYANQTII